MNTIDKSEQFIFQTYQRQGKALVKGEGVFLYDEDGKEYTDFLAGIAVCSLGHCHPQITEAICKQASTLVHVSNLFYTKPPADLATKLCELSFADRVFFSNSGAEANEAAIKLARRYFRKKGETKRYRIISMLQSFHGRTMATLSATGQDKVQEGFSPLLEGFTYVPFNDFEALKKELDDTVCAVLLEPVQGEGGIIPADPEYLKAVRDICTETGTLLIFDEIQCGMGRCAKLFAHENYNITPDIMTLAKALGNGIPIGAMLATQEAATGFDYGSHASTFGGNPLAAAAALEVVKIISEPAFLQKVSETGQYFNQELLTLKDKHTRIVDVRGEGLLLGLEVDKDAGSLVGALMEKGFIINGIQDKVLRFAPPLIIQKQDIDRLITVLDSLL
jgi:acetylornithine/N-succinyldiaminopimelate aminotransferase